MTSCIITFQGDLKSVMKNTKAAWKKFAGSKNIKEMFNNIPWGFIEILAAIPAVLFIIGEVQRLINLLFGDFERYDSIILTIHQYTGYLGIAVWILFLGKKMAEGSLKSLKNNYPMIFFTIMVILMLASTWKNGFTEYAKHGYPDFMISLFVYIMYPMAFFFLSSLIKKVNIKKFIVLSFLSFSIVVSLVSIINYYILSGNINAEPLLLNSDLADKVRGLFYNSNHYGYYLTISIMLCNMVFISEKNPLIKALAMFGFIVNNFTLIINNTLGAYLACACGLIFSAAVLLIKNKKINYLSLLTIVIFILITVITRFWFDTITTSLITFGSDVKKVVKNTEDSGSAGTGRWRIWKFVMEKIKTNPLLGYGTEGITDELISQLHVIQAHNETMHYAASYGIPAAVSYVLAIFSVFVHGYKNRKHLDTYTLASLTAAFGYYVSSCFGNVKFYTAPLFFIFLGLGYGIKKEK